MQIKHMTQMSGVREGLKSKVIDAVVSSKKFGKLNVTTTKICINEDL